MLQHGLRIGLCFYFAVIGISQAKAQTTIEINTSVKSHDFIGVGGALTESTVINLLTLKKRVRRDLLKKLFSTNGYGLSAVRIPVGSSDFSDPIRGHYTYNDTPHNRPDLKLKYFSARRDEKTFKVLKEILRVNPEVKIILAPWSAPAWMKLNLSLTGRTSNNRLDPQYRDVYARYLLRTVREYQRRGFKVFSLSLLNEPAHDTGDYPCMGMSAYEQGLIISQFLGPCLKALSPETKLQILDHNWNLLDYVDEVLMYPGARKYADAISFHCYGGSVDIVSLARMKYPDLDIYQTECTGWTAPFVPSEWWLDIQVIEALGRGSSLVLAWNIALNEKHGPYNGGCSVCNGLVTVNSVTGQITPSPELESLALVGRHVRPGAAIIDQRIDSPAIQAVSFMNKNNERVTIMRNLTSQNQSVILSNGGSERQNLLLHPHEMTSVVW